MKIEPKQIKIREVFDGYADQGDDGVFAYGGRLAIRPPYQREFVYDNDQAESRDSNGAERLPSQCYVLGQGQSRQL